MFVVIPKIKRCLVATRQKNKLINSFLLVVVGFLSVILQKYLINDKWYIKDYNLDIGLYLNFRLLEMKKVILMV